MYFCTNCVFGTEQSLLDTEGSTIDNDKTPVIAHAEDASASLFPQYEQFKDEGVRPSKPACPGVQLVSLWWSVSNLLPNV